MLKIDTESNERAEREALIETKYIGKTATLVGTTGDCFYHIKDDQWFYRPAGEEDFYRVDAKNLSCNEENGWIKCNYKGYNSTIGKTGKAYFDDVENVWMYKPKGGKELFRVQDASLTFLRDKDVEGVTVI